MQLLLGDDDARRSLAQPQVDAEDITYDEISLAPPQVDDDEGSDDDTAPQFSGFIIRGYTHEPGSLVRVWLESSLSTGLTLVGMVCAVRREVLTSCTDFDRYTDDDLGCYLSLGLQKRVDNIMREWWEEIEPLKNWPSMHST